MATMIPDPVYQILTGGHAPAATARGAGALGWRLTRAAAADPQNAWQNLFTIAGGQIIITSLIGIRTVGQAGGASTMQFRHSVGPTVLDAGTLAITGDAIGTFYVLTGDTTDPIIAGAAGIATMMAKVVATSTRYGSVGLFLAGAGTIDVFMSAAAGTGSTSYILTYIPLADAVTVV